MRIAQQPCMLWMCREQAPLEELICGTAYYCAPEVWVNDYGPKVDVWAAGVVLYLALHGIFPFYDRDPSALEGLICKPQVRPSFRPVCAKECPQYQVSEEAHMCLQLLLTKEYTRRPSATSASAEPWLRDAAKRAQRSRSSSMRQQPPSFGAGINTPEGKDDYVVPGPVRAKAARAAARPPVDRQREQGRTAALEALKARASQDAVAAFARRRGPHSPATGESDRVCADRSAGAGNFSIPDQADTSMSGSDLDDGPVACTCK